MNARVDTSPSTDPDDMVEELVSPPPATASGRYQIEKIRYSHDAMIDMLIAQPGIRQNDLAARFGYSAAWVSTVMATDAFKARLAFRRAELVDPEIVATIEERFEALTKRSLEVLAVKLAQPANLVPDQLALRAAELGAKVAGKGAFGVPIVQAPAGDHLDALAKRLVALQGNIRREAGGVVDVQAREIPDGEMLADPDR